jgi:hypothetical protein
MVASRWFGVGLIGAALFVSPVAPSAISQAPTARRLPGCEPGALVQRAAAFLVSAGESFQSVVAAEDYRQQTAGTAEPERPALPPILIRDDIHVPPPPTSTSRPGLSRRHRAAFLFVRRHDDLGWVGFRDVREVNGRAVDVAGPPLAPHQAIGEPLLEQWRRRSGESVRHHLGPIARRLNVPTAALRVLRPADRDRFTFAAAPEANRGHCRVTFQETVEPTILQSGIDDDVPASGSFLIDEATGRIVSSELMGANRASGVASKTTVRYERDRQLDRWVPREMVEEFVSRWGERLRGVATYSDYRTVAVTASVKFDK